MAMMDDLIEEMFAEYEPRFILDEPIPEAEERLLPRPLQPHWPFTDLDDRVPHPVRLPAESWVDFFFFFFWIWVLRPFQEYFTYIEPIVHRRWAKTGEPGEKPPDHP